MAQAVIGALRVNLGLNTAQFRNGLRSAQKSLQNAGKRMQAIGRSMSIAITAPLAAIGTVAARAFDKQIQAERRLAASIRVTGGVVEDQLALFKEFASTLQSITTVGDEATLANIQVAKSMGLSAQQSARAAKNAIALSDAFGINEKTAIRYTAALEEGDSTMLNRYIPTLRNIENQTERVAEAQRILNDAFQLSIESARAGLGPLRQLNNNFGDLLEQFGAIVVEGINPFIARINQAVLALKGMPETTKRVIVAVAGFTAILGPAVLALGLFTRGLAFALAGFVAFGRGFRRVVRFVVVEIGLLAAAFASPVGAAIAATTAIVAVWVGFKDTMIALAREIIEGIRRWLVVKFDELVAQPFTAAINDLIGQLPERVQRAIGFKPIELNPVLNREAIQNAEKLLDAIGIRLRRVQDKLAEGVGEAEGAVLNRIQQGLITRAQELQNRIESLRSGEIEAGGDRVGTAGSRIAEAFQRDLGKIRGEFNAVIEGIKARLPEGLFDALFGDLEDQAPDIEAAQRRIEELMAQLPDGGVPAALAGKGGAGGKAVLAELDKELAKIGETLGRLPPELEGVRFEIQQLGEDMAHSITTPLKDALTGGVQGFQSFSDTMVRIAQNLTNRLMEELFKPVEEALAKLFSQSGGGGGGGIFGAIGSALSGLFGGGGGGFLGGGVGRVPIGFRQHGGRVRAGQPVIVGEKRPELFVPDVSGMVLPRVSRAAMGERVARGDGEGGQRSGGNVYYIDNSNSTAESYRELRRVLEDTVGPGKFERRAVAAVADAKQRGHPVLRGRS